LNNPKKRKKRKKVHGNKEPFPIYLSLISRAIHAWLFFIPEVYRGEMKEREGGGKFRASWVGGETEGFFWAVSWVV
jgi:hypothetical protein